MVVVAQVEPGPTPNHLAPGRFPQGPTPRRPRTDDVPVHPIEGDALPGSLRDASVMPEGPVCITVEPSRTAAGVRVGRHLRTVAREARASASFTVPIALLSALGWVGTLAAPLYLSSHTTWVLLAAPRPSFVILAGNGMDFWLLLTIMVGRAMCAKPFNYMLGRRWGPKIVDRVSRRSQRGAWIMAWLERAVDRWGVWLVLIRADGRVMNLVGARKLNPVKVGAAALVNAVVCSVLFLKAASQIARVGDAFGRFWSLTPIGLVAALVAFALAGVLLVRRIRIPWRDLPDTVAARPVPATT
jgi:membrane protein DedA with SNARE-associated domain